MSVIETAGVKNVKVLALGGTLLCREVINGDSVTAEESPLQGVATTEPQLEVLDDILAQVNKDVCSNITICRRFAEKLFDSSDTRNEILQTVVDYVRAKLHTAEAFIIIYGTDMAPELMHALCAGVPRSLSEEKNQPIIVTCSQKHYDADESDAVQNLEDALILSQMDWMRGKVALCCGGLCFPGPGLEKKHRTKLQPFDSRNKPIAVREPRTGPSDLSWFERWEERPERMDIAIPFGNASEHYELASDLDVRNFGSDTNYEYFADDVERAEKGNTYRGFVIVAPGQGNLRSKNEHIEQIQRAGKYRVPIVVVGKARSDAQSFIDAAFEEQIYPGDSRLIGSKSYIPTVIGVTEARLHLAHGIACIERAGLHLVQDELARLIANEVEPMGTRREDTVSELKILNDCMKFADFHWMEGMNIKSAEDIERNADAMAQKLNSSPDDVREKAKEIYDRIVASRICLKAVRQGKEVNGLEYTSSLMRDYLHSDLAFEELHHWFDTYQFK